MFLGGYVSFALHGKFSQLDFNQFNFCRQRLCMGDLFFEQGIGLYIYKIGLENFEMHDWRKLPGGFRIFWAHSNRTVRLQVLGYKKCQIFGSCIDLGHIFKKSGFGPYCS